jgi:hypothetical protein
MCENASHDLGSEDRRGDAKDREKSPPLGARDGPTARVPMVVHHCAAISRRARPTHSRCIGVFEAHVVERVAMTARSNRFVVRRRTTARRPRAVRAIRASRQSIA